MGRRLRKFLLIFIGVLSVVVLIGALLIGLFTFFFPDRWAARKASEAGTQFLAEKEKGWRVEVDSLSPLPLGTFSVGGIRVRTPSGQLFVEINGIQARYSVLPLLKKTVRVEELSIQGVVVHLAKENGVWNFQRMAALFPEPVPPPPTLMTSVNWTQTPFPELWGEIDRALAKLYPLPDLEMEKAQLRDLRIVADDGAGLHAESPPIWADLRLKYTSSEKNGRFVVEIPEKSTWAAALPARSGAALKLLGESALKFDVEWLRASALQARVVGRLSGLTAQEGDETVSFPPVECSGDAALDLETGMVHLRSEKFDVPGWFSASGLLEMKRFGLDDSFLEGVLSLRNETANPALVKWLGRRFSLPPKLPSIAANAKGKFRLTQDSVEKLFRVADQNSLPVQAQGQGDLSAQDLPQAFFSEKTGLRSIQAKLDTSMEGQSARVSGSVELKELRAPSLPRMDLVARSTLATENLRTFQLHDTSLNIPTLGLLASLDIDAASAISLLQLLPSKTPTSQSINFRTLRENLSGSIQAKLAVDGTKASKALADVQVSGTMNAGLTLEKLAVDRVTARLEAHTQDFSLVLGKGAQRRAVTGMTAHLPVEKTIFLGPAKAPSRTRADVWTQAFAQGLRPVSPFADAVRITSIEANGQTLSNISIDAGFDGTNLVVDRFVAGLLGGSIWGRLTFLPSADLLRTALELEVAELDIAQLTQAPSDGDARISADSRATLNLKSTGNLSVENLMDEINADFHLTKIGEKTLDRLILFMDPAGENPSFVQARGLLKKSMVEKALRDPRVSFGISHGILDADIVLPGVSLVDVSIPIRGISIKNLLKTGDLRRSIEASLPLLQWISYLQVEGIDDQGNLVFSKPSNAESKL